MVFLLIKLPMVKLVKYIIACFLFISCSSVKKHNKTLTAKHSYQALVNDLEIAHSALQEAHPGLYWYISKDQLTSKFDSLKNSIKDSLTSLQFYQIFAPLVADIKCGHTRLVYPGIKLNKHQQDSIKKLGQLPLTQLKYFVQDSNIYVKGIKSNSLQSIQKGDELLSINQINADEILKKEKSLFASDGYNQTFKNQILNSSFANYYYLAYGKKDTLNIKIKRDTNLLSYKLTYVKPIKKNSQTTNKADQKKDSKLAKDQKKFERRNAYKGFDADKKPLLDFKIDTVLPHTGIMKVKDFSFEKSNFSRFFKESFKEIENNNIENVILDLRDNGGGKLMACNLLFRYLYNQPHKFTGRAEMNARNFTCLKYKEESGLTKVFKTIFYPSIWLGNQLIIKKDSLGFYSKLPTDKLLKPKKHAFNGNLLVLINGHSFSATSLLSANLQSVNRGVFIGEETGGGYNKCTAGNIPYIILPESGLKLRLPLKVIPIVNQRLLEGRGVFPNYEVAESLNELIENKDAILNKAKELIISNN